MLAGGADEGAGVDLGEGSAAMDMVGVSREDVVIGAWSRVAW